MKLPYPQSFSKRLLKSDEINSFIYFAVRRSLPWLSAEEANARIVELEVEVLRLKAIIDAKEIKNE